MLEYFMTSPLSVKVPPLLLNQLDYISSFHANYI